MGVCTLAIEWSSSCDHVIWQGGDKISATPRRLLHVCLNLRRPVITWPPVSATVWFWLCFTRKSACAPELRYLLIPHFVPIPALCLSVLYHVYFQRHWGRVDLDPWSVPVKSCCMWSTPFLGIWIREKAMRNFHFLLHLSPSILSNQWPLQMNILDAMCFSAVNIIWDWIVFTSIRINIKTFHLCYKPAKCGSVFVVKHFTCF